MKIGLDFGTTNSVVSFWDEKSQEPRVFNFNNNSYIPSILAWDNISENVYGIGIEARNKWDNNPKRYNLLQTFKTLLPHKERSHWESKGWNSDKSPEEITKRFIEWLLLSSSGSLAKDRKEKISNIVVSVPQYWQKEKVNNGAEILQRVLNELNLPLQQLVSEPLAAVAYYIWKANLKENVEKRILVFDMGGGTFDVSWCIATRNKIEVIKNEGNDEDLAGMFHLREIIRNALKRQGRELREEDAEFKKYVWRLENFICGDKEQEDLEKRFRRFRKSPEKYDNEVETLNGFPIYSGDVFNAYVKIQEGIQEVINSLDREVSDLNSFDQILLVGGFSKYFLVRKTILDYFKLREDDERVSVVSKSEGYLAIAHGAALLAANQVKIIEKYPHTISYHANLKNKEPVTLIIIEANHNIKGKKRFFAKEPVRVERKKFTLEGNIFINGDKSKVHKISKPISLQNIELKDDLVFRVGIEINK